jgi:hypothetical protein
MRARERDDTTRDAHIRLERHVSSLQEQLGTIAAQAEAGSRDGQLDPPVPPRAHPGGQCRGALLR